MRLKPIEINTEEYPNLLLPYFSGAKLFDSSCSEAARVIYIEKDEGYFLKISPMGTLEKEYKMTRFFYEKGLAADIAEYTCDGKTDYLLTKKVCGADCTAKMYIEQPKRLCDTLAESLARLHSVDYTDCPIMEHTESYRNVIDSNYNAGCFDLSFCPVDISMNKSDKVYEYVNEHFHLLQSDTLIHGDYCLPNIILNNWKLSGFVDVGNGGVGDRHVDLFWGAWTLRYNLGTDKYRDRFFDAYGRDKIDEERLKLIGACEAFG